MKSRVTFNTHSLLWLSLIFTHTFTSFYISSFSLTLSLTLTLLHMFDTFMPDDRCVLIVKKATICLLREFLRDVAQITCIQRQMSSLMTSLHSRYHDIERQFVHLDHRSNYSIIIAILLDNSSIYFVKEERYEQHWSDWNEIIIVFTKLAILHLVNEQQRSLMKMLSIVREECSELRVLDSSFSHWNQFDAVEFSDFDRLEIKRSVKILSLDYFVKFKISLFILFFKNKRIFEAFESTSTRFYRVQQATRLKNELFILHDQWIHVTSAIVCVHEQKASFAVFDVTADLLIFDVWLLEHDSYERLI